MNKTDEKIDAALDRYLRARKARGEDEGTFEEFHDWACRQDIINHEDMQEFIARKYDEVWIANTRVALGLDEYEDDESDRPLLLQRLVVEPPGRSILLPHIIVNAGEDGDEFSDTRHWALRYASVGHHRKHAELMIRSGNVEGGREQLAANVELLRRAGGDESALIGDLLS